MFLFILFLMKVTIPSDKIPQEVFSDLSKEQGLMKNWKFVGRRLKVDDGCLDEIEDHHKYLSERSYNMLLAWQEKFGGDVHVLMKALRKENLNRLAGMIFVVLVYNNEMYKEQFITFFHMVQPLITNLSV